ncbi:hypothetical protein CHO01_22060 [Cellulomonas hominis]|uniref:Runt domain-containing protein n=1 Tax=Cellulomonas hominis TaxID=156981 RepID=A0A511FCV5_9CELL|nr:hypothetical protein [Cellulomonas hominis]NKY05795.1 hypothetical protein [Cellulomonas hominis]GEL47090.1 hypothetical protein CHO01_22060 [Cellulomonas hominis]
MPSSSAPVRVRDQRSAPAVGTDGPRDPRAPLHALIPVQLDEEALSPAIRARLRQDAADRESGACPPLVRR